MKCPKCDYLGFDTGDRCRNCGYDFSLLTGSVTDAAPIDLPLTTASGQAPVLDVTLHEAPLTDRTVTPSEIALHLLPAEPEEDADALPASTGHVRPVPITRGTAAVEPALPLFHPIGDADDDTPLVKLPAAPRAPLSVRKTPDTPRLRAVPRHGAAGVSQKESEPRLFIEPEREAASPSREEPRLRQSDPDEDSGASSSRVWRQPAGQGASGSAPRRLTAALLDHVILFGIDLVVVYFTLRMVGLELDGWAVLPKAPLVSFLVLIKLAYFSVFTALGGQTVGKMAMRIRVVNATGGELDGGQVLRRVLFGALSALALGLGFVPGLFGDRRALHDRAAETRVVGLESA